MTNEQASELEKRAKSICREAINVTSDILLHWTGNSERVAGVLFTLRNTVSSVLDQAARETFLENQKCQSTSDQS